METKKLAPHIEELYRAIGEKVEKENIEKELDNYLNVYRITLEDAKRNILKKYGGKTSTGVPRKLSELLPNEQTVDVLCKLLTVNKKEIEVEGVKKNVIFGLATDNTATLSYTAWVSETWNFNKGDIIIAKNAYTSVKAWQGKPQLNFGSRCNLEKAEFAFPVRYEEVRVKDFSDGRGNISTKVRILSVGEREVEVDGTKKTVYSGVIGDATGKANFTAWVDFGLKVGMAVKITGGYIRAWRGIPKLNFDSNVIVESINDNELPSIEEINNACQIPIEDIETMGGGLDVILNGVVIEVKSGSGLIFRCPECNRVLQNTGCKLHGNIEGIQDMRIKAVLDDGTGALTIVLNRELTEKLLRRTMEDCIETERKTMKPDTIIDEITELLVAKPICVRGNVTKDDFGFMMIATSVEPFEIDIRGSAKKMLTELGMDAGVEDVKE